jgi:hypothetical protein
VIDLGARTLDVVATPAYGVRINFSENSVR